MSAPRSETGFSLVETLVALAIIAAMAGILFAAIATHARAAQHIAEKRVAILLAQSLLAQAMVAPGPGALPDAGRSTAGAFTLSWRLSRRAIGQDARDEGAPLEEVRLDLFDAATARRLTSVRTLRLAR